MQRGTKIYTVDKFLGINEAADGAIPFPRLDAVAELLGI